MAREATRLAMRATAAQSDPFAIRLLQPRSTKRVDYATILAKINGGN
jgi:hypothetical protein